MFSLSRSRSSALLAGAAVVGAVTAFSAMPADAGMRAPHRFQEVDLVSDQPGVAPITDPSLVNAWGLAFSPTSPIWVSNNGSDSSTLYNGATSPTVPVAKVPLTVSIPGSGAPTGVVFNPTTDFTLSTGGKSGPAAFIFAGEDGALFGWNGTGDATQAVQVTPQPTGTVYKGLTMVTVRHQPFLLAANFAQNRVDVYDGSFMPVSKPWAFRSPRIPQGYAPFDVASLGGRVYVTYAEQDAAKMDDVAGRGHGFLSVFTSQGRFLRTLVRRGPLDSPWGLAIAPRGFGGYGGKLLVGNFGDGRIHVLNRTNGHVVATLRDGSGKPLAIDGLWGLLPGNGVSGGTSDVWFSAGPAGESHGLLGLLRTAG